MAFVFRAFAAAAREHPGCRVGVFLDYVSLPQKNRDGDDDRSDKSKSNNNKSNKNNNRHCPIA